MLGPGEPVYEEICVPSSHLGLPLDNRQAEVGAVQALGMWPCYLLQPQLKQSPLSNVHSLAH